MVRKYLGIHKKLQRGSKTLSTRIAFNDETMKSLRLLNSMDLTRSSCDGDGGDGCEDQQALLGHWSYNHLGAVG